jgi:hypothetical protein
MIDPRLPTFSPCLACHLLAVFGNAVEDRLIDPIDFPIGDGELGRLPTLPRCGYVLKPLRE